jgi:hypothetical protein
VAVGSSFLAGDFLRRFLLNKLVLMVRQLCLTLYAFQFNIVNVDENLNECIVNRTEVSQS